MRSQFGRVVGGGAAARCTDLGIAEHEIHRGDRRDVQSVQWMVERSCAIEHLVHLGHRVRVPTIDRFVESRRSVEEARHVLHVSCFPAVALKGCAADVRFSTKAQTHRTHSTRTRARTETKYTRTLCECIRHCRCTSAIITTILILFLFFPFSYHLWSGRLNRRA